MFYPKSYIFPQKFAISTYLMVKHGSSWALLTASHMWITQLSILGQVNVDCCWFHICFHISKMCFRASDFKWIYWTMFGPTVNLFFSKLIIVHYRCSPRTLITRTVLGRSVVFFYLGRTDSFVVVVPYYYSIGIVFGALVSLLGLYWIELEKNKTRNNPDWRRSLQILFLLATVSLPYIQKCSLASWGPVVNIFNRHVTET